MLPIHTILHPTDFSTNSNCALQVAGALARDYGAELIVLHVAPMPTAIYGIGEGVVPPRTEWDQELREELDQIHVADATVHLSHRLEEGDPVSEILRVAEETHADMIVLGTHGRRGMQRLLMGSVAELVVRRAKCPVLTVRTPFPEHAMATEATGMATENAAFAGSHRE
jgi:nucleotide-binding universal stress UspA family protein